MDDSFGPATTTPPPPQCLVARRLYGNAICMRRLMARTGGTSYHFRWRRRILENVRFRRRSYRSVLLPYSRCLARRQRRMYAFFIYFFFFGKTPRLFWLPRNVALNDTTKESAYTNRRRTTCKSDLSVCMRTNENSNTFYQFFLFFPHR